MDEGHDPGSSVRSNSSGGLEVDDDMEIEEASGEEDDEDPVSSPSPEAQLGGSLPLAEGCSDLIQDNSGLSTSDLQFHHGQDDEGLHKHLHLGGKPLSSIRRGPGRPRKDKPPSRRRKSIGLKLKRWKSNIYMRSVMKNPLHHKEEPQEGLEEGEVLPPESPSPVRVVEDVGTAEMEQTVGDGASSAVPLKAEKMPAPDEPPLFQEQWPGKVCSLCNLGERSQLGQGDLMRLSCPEGFTPNKTSPDRGDGESLSGDACPTEAEGLLLGGDKSPRGGAGAVTVRRQKSMAKCRNPPLGNYVEPVDELSVVGYLDEPEVGSIFEASGHFYVHQSCALWSVGVTRTEDLVLENVGPAVLQGSSRRCTHCSHFGASITCVAASCLRFLHFPCAAASGAFQDCKTVTLVCNQHLDQVPLLLSGDVSCMSCFALGDVSNLMMCTMCGHHYHGSCVGLALLPGVRAGWQCPDCRICQVCRQPEEDSKVMLCECCDKAYHPSCLRPVVTTIPKYGWKCKCCRVCSDCGSRTPGAGLSSRWHAHYTVCDSCYQQRNKGFSCPLCRRAYRAAAYREMVQCSLCRKFVHGTCDPEADPTTYQHKKDVTPDYEYVCLMCKSLSHAGRLKRKDSTEDCSLDSSLSASQESLYLGDDSNLDIDYSPADKYSREGGEDVSMRAIGLGKGKPFCASKIAKKKLGLSSVSGRPKGLGKGGGGLGKVGYQKRQRVTEFGRKRGPKAKMRGIFGVPGLGLQRPQADSNYAKLEEEPGVENRLVLCSSKDKFVLTQDICVMCGALGIDQEGCLIACSQCGQCYHPYCVNVKVTKVILQKGWRCLDCTVCEGCGQKNDEARLILCDDCDISYHIYCMDPPLDYVPHGNWKCKWCATCLSCGANDPGFNCTWQKSFTECGPCASHATCPSCLESYSEGELIIQCVQCERWLHCTCDQVRTEAEAERCAEEGYNCVLCRPRDVPPPHLLPPPPPPKPPTPIKSPEEPRLLSEAQFYMDGVCLSEMGLHQIKSLTLEQQQQQVSSRKKRPPKKAPTKADKEAGILATIESVATGGSLDNSLEDMEEVKEEPVEVFKEGMIVPPREDGRPPEPPEGFNIYTTDSGVMVLRRKRQRNLQKLGIGGFIARLRGTRCKEKEEEGGGEGATTATTATTPTADPVAPPPAPAGPTTPEDKPRRKPQRRKPRNKLMESYPSYLQEAFFGRDLLDTTKERELGSSSDSEEERTSPLVTADKTIQLSQDELKAMEEIKAKQDKDDKKVEDSESGSVSLKSPGKEDDEGSDSDALKDILPLSGDLLDTDLVNTIMNEDDDDIKNGDNLDDITDSVLADDAELNDSLSMTETGAEVSSSAHKDELTDILSPHFNLESMVRESGLPNMDSKDVEEIIKGVLTDESQESQESVFPLGPVGNPHVHPPVVPPGPPGIVSPSHGPHPVLQPGMGLARSQVPGPLPSVVQSNLSSPIGFPPPSPYHSEYSNSPQFSPAFSEPPSPWVPQGDTESGLDGPAAAATSVNQRSNIKMEADEALGGGATISSVLYANLNHPEWKKEYPAWADRSKQILKKWRALASERKAPYLQQARENRSSLRMKKSQPMPKEVTKPTVASASPTVVMPAAPAKQPPPLAAAVAATPATDGPAEVCPGLGKLRTSSPDPQFTVHHHFHPSSGPPRPVLTSTPAPNVVVGREPSLGGGGGELLGRLSMPQPIASPNTSVADQQIRVLTPSEIMRTLPSLGQEGYDLPGNTLPMDQEKMLQQQKTCREAEQERQWKQLQAMRQQQAQQQQQVIHEQRVQAMARVHRQISVDGVAFQGEQPGQPLTTQLQVSTAQDPNSLGPLSSPSPGSRQFPIPRSLPPPHSPGSFSLPGRPQTTPPDSSDPSYPRPLARSPGYATPRPQFSAPTPRTTPQVVYSVPRPPQDPYAQQPPTPRPAQDPYTSQPQTPRPSPSVDPYASQPQTPRDLYATQPQTPRPQPDPYASQPPTPRPASVDPYANQPQTPRPAAVDPYASQPQTPRPADPYASQPQTPRPADPYSQQPATPRPRAEGELFGQGGTGGPEVTRQLRDLLQRQQFKKLEQDLAGPQRIWPEGQQVQDTGLHPAIQQQQQQQGVVHFDPPGGTTVQQPQQSSVPQLQSPGADPTFRQPLPPALARPRMPLQGNVVIRGPGVRHPLQGLDPRMQVVDARSRLLIQQQRGQGYSQHMVHRMAGPRNPLDPYDHIVQHRQIAFPQDGTSGSQGVLAPNTTGIAQRLARQAVEGTHPGQLANMPMRLARVAPPGQQLEQPAQQRLVAGPASVTAPVVPQDTQEIPESVTAELEKLEQEVEVEGVSAILADLGDDEELLGEFLSTFRMGNDFNILEYADPDLAGVSGGEKTNILDENLDLEEEENKEEHKGVKRELPARDRPDKPVEPARAGETSAETLQVKRETNLEGKNTTTPAPTSLGTVEAGVAPPAPQNQQPTTVTEQAQHPLPQQGVLGRPMVTGRMLNQDGVAVSFQSTFPQGGKQTVVTTGQHLQRLPSGHIQVQQQRVQMRLGPGMVPAGSREGPARVVSVGPGGKIIQHSGLAPQGRIGLAPPPPPYPGPPPPYPGPCQQMPPAPGMRGIGVGLPLGPPRPPPIAMMPQMVAAGGMMHPPGGLGPAPHLQRRPLLLQEQPLLLEDLLEQEKREQEKQQQQGSQPLQSPAPSETSPALLSDVEFERLRADVLGTPTGGSPGLGSPPQGIPPQGIPAQGMLQSPNMLPVGAPLRPPYPPRPASQPPSKLLEWQQGQVPVGMEPKMGPGTILVRQPQPPLAPVVQGETVGRVPLFSAPHLPAPPLPPETVVTEQDRQTQLQYEQWLNHQNQVLTSQLKYYETEVNKLRKVRKSLNSKQRQLRKSGNELAEPDALELQRITGEQAVLQKQLDSSRKQSRQHGMLMTENRNKQQQKQRLQQQVGPPMMGPCGASSQQQTVVIHSPLGPPASSPGHHPSTPQSPMMSPSPSPLHSPGPLLSHSPGPGSMLQHSPGNQGPGSNSGLSPHSLQPSPRMGTPHSQQSEDSPFSPGTPQELLRSLPSPQQVCPPPPGRLTSPQGQMTPRMTSPQHRMGVTGAPQGLGRPVTSPVQYTGELRAVQQQFTGEQIRLHGMTPRFVRAPMTTGPDGTLLQRPRGVPVQGAGPTGVLYGQGGAQPQQRPGIVYSSAPSPAPMGSPQPIMSNVITGGQQQQQLLRQQPAQQPLTQQQLIQRQLQILQQQQQSANQPAQQDATQQQEANSALLAQRHQQLQLAQQRQMLQQQQQLVLQQRQQHLAMQQRQQLQQQQQQQGNVQPQLATQQLTQQQRQQLLQQQLVQQQLAQQQHQHLLQQQQGSQPPSSPMPPRSPMVQMGQPPNSPMPPRSPMVQQLGQNQPPNSPMPPRSPMVQGQQPPNSPMMQYSQMGGNQPPSSPMPRSPMVQGSPMPLRHPSGGNSINNSPQSVERPQSTENPSTPRTPYGESTQQQVEQEGNGSGGGNPNNPGNPLPLPPSFGRFGYFKLGLRGGSPMWSLGAGRSGRTPGMSRGKEGPARRPEPTTKELSSVGTETLVVSKVASLVCVDYNDFDDESSPTPPLTPPPPGTETPSTSTTAPEQSKEEDEAEQAQDLSELHVMDTADSIMVLQDLSESELAHITDSLGPASVIEECIVTSSEVMFDLPEYEEILEDERKPSPPALDEKPANGGLSSHSPAQEAETANHESPKPRGIQNLVHGEKSMKPDSPRSRIHSPVLEEKSQDSPRPRIIHNLAQEEKSTKPSSPRPRFHSPSHEDKSGNRDSPRPRIHSPLHEEKPGSQDSPRPRIIHNLTHEEKSTKPGSPRPRFHSPSHEDKSANRDSPRPRIVHSFVTEEKPTNQGSPRPRIPSHSPNESPVNQDSPRPKIHSFVSEKSTPQDLPRSRIHSFAADESPVNQGSPRSRIYSVPSDDTSSNQGSPKLRLHFPVDEMPGNQGSPRPKIHNFPVDEMPGNQGSPRPKIHNFSGDEMFGNQGSPRPRIHNLTLEDRPANQGSPRPRIHSLVREERIVALTDTPESPDQEEMNVDPSPEPFLQTPEAEEELVPATSDDYSTDTQSNVKEDPSPKPETTNPLRNTNSPQEISIPNPSGEKPAVEKENVLVEKPEEVSKDTALPQFELPPTMQLPPSSIHQANIGVPGLAKPAVTYSTFPQLPLPAVSYPRGTGTRTDAATTALSILSSVIASTVSVPTVTEQPTRAVAPPVRHATVMEQPPTRGAVPSVRYKSAPTATEQPNRVIPRPPFAVEVPAASIMRPLPTVVHTQPPIGVSTTSMMNVRTQGQANVFGTMARNMQAPPGISTTISIINNALAGNVSIPATSMQLTPATVASLVADAVNSARLPYPPRQLASVSVIASAPRVTSTTAIGVVGTTSLVRPRMSVPSIVNPPVHTTASEPLHQSVLSRILGDKTLPGRVLYQSNTAQHKELPEPSEKKYPEVTPPQKSARPGSSEMLGMQKSSVEEEDEILLKTMTQIFQDTRPIVMATIEKAQRPTSSKPTSEQDIRNPPESLPDVITTQPPRVIRTVTGESLIKQPSDERKIAAWRGSIESQQMMKSTQASVTEQQTRNDDVKMVDSVREADVIRPSNASVLQMAPSEVKTTEAMEVDQPVSSSLMSLLEQSRIDRQGSVTTSMLEDRLTAITTTSYVATQSASSLVSTLTVMPSVVMSTRVSPNSGIMSSVPTSSSARQMPVTMYAQQRIVCRGRRLSIPSPGPPATPPSCTLPATQPQRTAAVSHGFVSCSMSTVSSQPRLLTTPSSSAGRVDKEPPRPHIARYEGQGALDELAAEVKLEEQPNKPCQFEQELLPVKLEKMEVSCVSIVTEPLVPKTESGQTSCKFASPPPGRMEESQNVLLKQLLQNTGCAQTPQPPVVSQQSAAPAVTTHHHSSSVPSLEAQLARLAPPPPADPALTTTKPQPVHRPQPQVLSRETSFVSRPPSSSPRAELLSPTSTPSPLTSPQAVIKREVVAAPPPSPVVHHPIPASEVKKEPVEEVSPGTDRKDFFNKMDVTKEEMGELGMDPVSDKMLQDQSALVDIKKMKRRLYQQKRRQSQGKESVSGGTPKKRQRKGSKVEEDYDSFIESLMAQLRQIPAMSVLEPELSRNFSVCAIFGSGDLTKVGVARGYSTRQGDLAGSYGAAAQAAVSDHYNTQPFGDLSPLPPQPPVSTQRGFYDQEFAPLKLDDDDKKEGRERDNDTPDTIVSSSSPECVVPEVFVRFPGLRLIEEEDSEDEMLLKRSSPIIPIIAPIPIRMRPGVPYIKDEVDKENVGVSRDPLHFKSRFGMSPPAPLKDSGNVTVTLTLTSAAADDILGVLRDLANVLRIPAPSSYQIVERTSTPPSQKLGLYRTKGKDGKEGAPIDIQSILNGAAKFCRHCDVVILSNLIRKKASELPFLNKEDLLDNGDDLYFCSSTCYMQFALMHRSPTISQDKAAAIVDHLCQTQTPGGQLKKQKLTPEEDKEGATGIKEEKMETDQDKVEEKTRVKVEGGPAADKEVSAERCKEGDGAPDKESTISRSSSPGERRNRKHPGVPDEPSTTPAALQPPPAKIWKGLKYKYWSSDTIHPATKYKKPSDKEITEMLFRMGITMMPAKIPDDTRKCMFCHQIGDGLADGTARLLNFDVDKWVHLNCALWSDDVYETVNGALMNLENALQQSLVLTCVICQRSGATLRCFKLRCSNVYHLGCAVKDGCVFFKNKSTYCTAHIPKNEKDNELTTLSVFRRVYVNRDENRQVAMVMHHTENSNLLRVGSLIFLSVGQLLPHQLQAFHTAQYIYPIGFRIVRFYWSMRVPNKRCSYLCSIHDVAGRPEFRVLVQEPCQVDLELRDATPRAVWNRILEPMVALRRSTGGVQVFPRFMSGEDLFGLTEPAVVRVLESLPGVETLSDYRFKYGRNPLLELPLAINPTGSARSEPKLRNQFPWKRPHTQRTGSSSRPVFVPTVAVAGEAACPYSKQFVHSKSSQYKKMKQEWRNNVYLARSKIQGLGLYAARDLERHTMVIEYIGEVIRTELSEMREKQYEARNRGIYMFRLDEDRVVDATLSGGLARYINHSCNPNCVAEIVEVERDLRIIIFAKRRISRGEELAYDYKFDIEDDQHKIPCNCGAPNCRKWMN